MKLIPCSKSALIIGHLLTFFANIYCEEAKKKDAGISTCTIWRSVSSNGFHRELSTDVVISSLQFDNNSKVEAEIAVVETIPSSMYVDLYQTAMHEDFGGPKIYSASDIDVEKPAYDSEMHTIYVYGSPEIKNSAAHVNLSIPVHLRYNRPSSLTDTYHISLPSPMVLIRFTDGPWLGGMGTFITAPASNGTDVYWSMVNCKPGSGDGSVKLEVPVGQAQHTYLVVTGTLAVSIIGTIYLSVIIVSSVRARGSSTTSKKCPGLKDE